MRCCAASPGARRPVSTRCPAPCAARYPAISSPTEPSPPVTRYVASSRSASGVAIRLPGPPNQPGNIDRLIHAARSGLRRGRAARAATTWLINRDHSSAAAPRTGRPVRPTPADAPARRRGQNPHRQLCSGDTVSASVTRCAPRVTTQMGVRSSAAAAARKSRRVPPRTRCCIRNSDRIDGAASESSAATCRMRSVGSSATAARNVTSAVPRRRRTPATRGSGAGGHARSARRPMAELHRHHRR